MDFKEEIVNILKPFAQIDVSLIEIPPDSKLGDYTVPCFKLAKQLKKAPQLIAEELAKQLHSTETFSQIKSTGAYLNFFINKSFYIGQLLSKVHKENLKFGTSKIGKGRNIVVDYSSPNIAKPFGIAHIRSTVIGNAICKIYAALGYNIIGVNHLGDWGTQFGKLMVAYLDWGDPKRLEKEGIDYLVEIYIEFGNKEKTDSSLDVKARAWFKKLEDKDPKAVELWDKFRNLSLVEFNKYYEELEIKFDYFQGESFYNDQLESTVQFVQSKVQTEESEGALIVNLKPKGIDTPLLLRKSDGATTYHTRDLAAALYRIKTWNPEKIVYVVGSPQKLHFNQLFTTLEMMGYKRNTFMHVDFGNMTYEGQMMSTRHGNFVRLSEVISKSIELAKKTIDQKNPDLKNKDAIARQVGIGAIIFGDLSNDRTRDVDFTWEKALNFDGETAPYLQYTHARICSILRKAEVKITGKIDAALLIDPFEFELSKVLGRFPEIIEQAATSFKPNLIANYLMELAQLFNKFYTNCPIIKEEANLRNARLLLADCTKIVLSNGLELLGIHAPQEM